MSFEYYRIRRTGDKFPLLVEEEDSPEYLHLRHEVPNPETMKFQFGPPVPRKPLLADYHSSSDSVMSGRLYDVLDTLNLFGVQLIPATIRDNKGKIHDNYWALHIYNHVECLDRELSDCKFRRSGIGRIKKLVLSKELLEPIPLEERLIFEMKEDSGFQLFHKSIVDKIMAIEPTGLRFIKLEEWNSSLNNS